MGKILNGKTVIRVAIRAKDKNTAQDFRAKLNSNANFREMNNLLRNKYGMNTVQLTTIMNVEVEIEEGYEDAICPKPGVEYGVAYRGNNIASNTDDPVEHWQICAHNCTDSNNCEFWTWHMGTKKCRFKSSKRGRKLSKSAISGHKYCVSECV